MRAAILATGTELTRGELVNGNAAWLSERLTELGFEVIEHAVVPDDSERIASTLARFGREVKLVVCTGGLGPTSDDLTAAVVASVLGVQLIRHAATLVRIEARYRAAGVPMPAINAKQADVPEGARVLDNAVGTAPAFAVRIGQAESYFLPGPPSEMRHLFETYLVPDLAHRVRRTTHQVHIRSFGLRESEAAERLASIDRGGAESHPDVTIGYRARFPEIEVKVHARAGDEASATTLANDFAARVRALLGTYAYGGKDESFPGHVGKLLTQAKLKVALAESCTGGLVGKLLTDPAGSSAYFVFSAAVYANSAKRGLLGVPGETIDKHGAVSTEVAAAMAEGALERAGADLAVAITGVAGPTGGTPDKPVGTVCFALAQRGRKTFSERRQLSGDRDRVRTLSAYVALALLARAAQSVIDGETMAPVQGSQANK
jgi:nicotinamide-nucleotide amidase